MNHADRLTVLAETCLLLETLRRGHLMTQLADEIAGVRNGYPTGHMGRGGDNTGMLTTAMAVDDAARHLREIDEGLIDMRSKARAIDDLRRRYMQPARVLSKTDQVSKSDAGCEVLARVGSWEPVCHVLEDATMRVGDDVVNLLDEGTTPRVMRLGSWAYGFARQHRRLPVEHETQTHVRGGRVRVKKAS